MNALLKIEQVRLLVGVTVNKLTLSAIIVRKVSKGGGRRFIWPTYHPGFMATYHIGDIGFKCGYKNLDNNNCREQ